MPYPYEGTRLGMRLEVKKEPTSDDDAVPDPSIAQDLKWCPVCEDLLKVRMGKKRLRPFNPLTNLVLL